jgi:hypothetical protein
VAVFSGVGLSAASGGRGRAAPALPNPPPLDVVSVTDWHGYSGLPSKVQKIRFFMKLSAYEGS